MSIENLKERWGDFAKDTRLNFSSVLSEEGAPDLSQQQIYGIALASAYATQSKDVIEAILAEAGDKLSEADRQAAKAAAIIMAMNNVYYRFTHLIADKDYAKLPARLRMNIIANPGIPKLDFELYSLAVSALSGCGMCMDAHVHEVTQAGLSKTGVQSTIRIASVVNAAARATAITDL